MVSKRAIAACAGTLLLFSLAPALPQPAPSLASVERPDPRVGDAWTFQRIDGWNGATDPPFVETITGVTEDEIETLRGKAKPIYNRDWNVVGVNERGTRSKSRTYGGTLSFPLSIGKSWSMTAEFTNASGQTLSYAPKAEVIAWQAVTVPAGTFEAFRIRSSGYYSGNSVGGARFSGTFEENYWYSPAAQRIVRYQFQNSAKTKFTVDLIEMRLVQR